MFLLNKQIINFRSGNKVKLTSFIWEGEIFQNWVIFPSNGLTIISMCYLYPQRHFEIHWCENSYNILNFNHRTILVFLIFMLYVMVCVVRAWPWLSVLVYDCVPSTWVKWMNYQETGVEMYNLNFKMYTFKIIL